MKRPPRKSPADRGLYPRRNAAGKAVWYVRLSHLGQLRTFGHFRTKTEARHFYQERKREQRLGQFFPEQWQRRHLVATTISEVVALAVKDYERHGRKSLHSAKQLAGWWTRTAGETKAVHLRARDLLAWADQWRSANLSAGTINRRMSFLLRGLRLAQQEQPPLVRDVPRWTRLREAHPRSGFLEWEDFVTIREALPGYAQLPATIGFWTGMRYGEIRALRRAQVTLDHRARTVRLALDATQTKTAQPRTIIMAGDLYEAIATGMAQPNPGATLCQRHGHPLGDMDTAWKSACITAGLATGRWQKSSHHWLDYSGPLFHDLRRTGVRNLIRAGVDRDTAKRISGHRTDAVFSRYNIVSEEDLIEAGRKVVNYLAQVSNKVRQPSETTTDQHVNH